MDNSDAICEAVSQELSECSTKVRALLSDATILSEQEVVAIGNRIVEMRRESQENVRSLDELAKHVGAGGADGRGGLEGAVRAQAESVAGFVRRLNAGVEEQRASTTGIMSVSKKIGAFVATIEGLSQELRMLTLNARLEAARWGQKGAAFATVASSMNELTGQVQRANEQLGELASALAGITTSVVSSETKMSALGAELADDAEKKMKLLLQAYSVASETSARTVDAGVSRARRLLALSDGMLTNLQFQDRMAQIFKEASSVVDHTKEVTVDFLESVPEGADEEQARAELERARLRAGSSAVRMSGESELNASDRNMEAGVVELF